MNTELQQEISHLLPKGQLNALSSRCFALHCDHNVKPNESRVRVKVATTPLETHCLQREALWLNRLRHSDLCFQQCHSLERHGQYTVLITNFIEGKSVDQLQRMACFGGVERKQVIEQLLNSLNELHGIGVIHGDIKLSNLLISPEGKLMLIDFSNSHRNGELLVERGISQVTPSYEYPKLLTRADQKQDRYAALLCISVIARATETNRMKQEDTLELIVDFYGSDEGRTALNSLELSEQVKKAIDHYLSDIVDDMSLPKALTSGVWNDSQMALEENPEAVPSLYAGVKR